MLEFLVEEARTEFEKVQHLLAHAANAETHGEAAAEARSADALMKKSQYAQLYGRGIIQNIIADRFLGEADITQSPAELRKELEQLIFKYQETYNGTMEPNQSMVERCIELAPLRCFNELLSIIGTVAQNEFDMKFAERYEMDKRVMGMYGKKPDPIKIQSDGKKITVDPDAFFYGSMINAFLYGMQAGKFNMSSKDMLNAMIHDYQQLRDKFEEVTGRLLMKEGRKDTPVLADELFAATLANVLTLAAKQNPEAAQDILAYRNGLVGNTQDFIHAKAEEAAASGKNDYFSLLAQAYVRFTANFAEPLEETEEEAKEEMERMAGKYFVENA